ncbi:DNA binding protein [Fragilaria crotonensis]|nr:DNA binding protein [Fragilaria crotonensis]
MDSLGARQEVRDGKRRNSGGDVLHRKRYDDEAHNSSEEARLARGSTATHTAHHDATPATYPTFLYPTLFETSSSTRFPLSTGIDEPLLNSHYNMLSFIMMDARGLGLPLPPRLHGAAFTPRFGIPNFNASAAIGEQLSELLPYSCGEAAAAIRRSTLFPFAGTRFPVINAFKTNGISPILLCEQRGMPTPGATLRNACVARGMSTNALFRQPPSALPSSQLANEIKRSFDLPSSFRPLPRTYLESTASITADLFGFSSLDNDGTDPIGGHEFFPMVLHRALAELELIEGGTDIAAFLPHGRSFQIRDQALFEEKVLPCFFPRMKGFPSFQRQLNLYKFQRRGGAGLDRNSYSHELFVRHQPELSRRMRRTRVKQRMHSLT